MAGELQPEIAAAPMQEAGLLPEPGPPDQPAAVQHNQAVSDFLSIHHFTFPKVPPGPPSPFLECPPRRKTLWFSDIPTAVEGRFRLALEETMVQHGFRLNQEVA